MAARCAPTNVLRAKIAAKKLGIGRSTFYLWQNPKSPYYEPTLPAPMKLGQRAVGWLEPELDAWLAGRADARTNAGEGK